MSHRCNYCRGVMGREAREASVSDEAVDARATSGERKAVCSTL